MHGLRRTYQVEGCRCLLCKAAEATYRARLRQRHLRGLPILGTVVSASEAWARIRVLQQEGFTRRQISGWTNRHLPVEGFTPACRIRLATLLKLRALCRRYLIAEADLPNHQRVDGTHSSNIEQK